MERTIKLHTEPVNGHAIRSIPPLSWRNHLLIEPKSSESPAPAQASPSGRPICPERPHNHCRQHTVTPRVDYPGASRSRLILSSIPVSISLVTSTSASWNTSLLAWSTNRPPVFDQPGLKAGQRPVLHRLRRRPAFDRKLPRSVKPVRTVRASPGWPLSTCGSEKPGPVQGVFAFFYPLLRRGTAIVKADYPFGWIAQVGHDETDSWGTTPHDATLL